MIKCVKCGHEPRPGPCQTVIGFGVKQGITDFSAIIEITKAEFDSHGESEAFAVGPYIETWGDGYGEPYNPYRQAFGKLRDGRVVYCELHPSRQPESTDEKAT